MRRSAGDDSGGYRFQPGTQGSTQFPAVHLWFSMGHASLVPLLDLKGPDGVFKIRLYGAVLAALAAGIGSAYGQPPSRRAAAPAPASPFASFAIANNVAVDGSTLSLRVHEGRLSRVIMMPDGTPKNADFILLTDRLGTVSEGAENGNVVGLFVLNQKTISTTYADGRSEILATDAAGRFAILAKDANGNMVCSSWFSAAHHFSAEEREDALAQYAKHLGLGMPRSRPGAQFNSAGCISEMKMLQPANASPPAGDEPQAAVGPDSRGGVLNQIMAQVFALYGRKEAAVPSYGGIATPSRREFSQSWDAFDRFYSSFVASHEGGYTENDGNGAPANYGINQGANPDVDVLTLTQAQAEQILYERYWLASGADRMPTALAAVHGDTAINLGLRAASELLAQSGGDPNTYLNLRDERYQAIAAANPDKANYLSVWLRRTEDLRDLLNSGTDLFVDRPSYSERLPQRQFSTLTASDPDR